MKRNTVTITIDILSHNKEDAISKAKKFCDVLNNKDKRNNAKIKKMVIHK
jgi:hypothetical protein